jgi:hypothetical protein
MDSANESAVRPKPESRETEDQPAQTRVRRPSLLSELAAFLGQNRKWWLLPIIMVLLLVGVLLVVSGGLLPIYTLF